MSYLFDADFLKKIDYHREREIYTRITALSIEDFPREEIVGRVTGGSINVDGASAVRRSCSLTLLALDQDTLVTDTYWCYDNKFKVEIGLKNMVDPSYPDIIWFNMGIYIITSFSKSKNTNNLTISLSGKDKMCRLNGEVSGNIMMSTNFGVIEDVVQIEETDSKTGESTTTYHTTVTKLPIYTIILNALKEYAQERQENIIINDLDQYGYELWEYRGDQPMYFFIEPGYNGSNAAVVNMTFNGDTVVDVVDDGFYAPDSGVSADKIKKICLKDLGTEEYPFKFFSMNTLDADYNIKPEASKIYWGGYPSSEAEAIVSKKCYVAKINYGETAGYHQIPLVYNSDLILKAGETVVSLLDKLKAMLGDFEYFYDLNGRFVFQKKNTYTQELFSPVDGEIVMPTTLVSKYMYKFEDESLFTAMSHSPNINNLKNDFSIWGSCKSATGQDLPIHARYSIHKKPVSYTLPYNRYTKYNNLYSISAEEIEITTEEEFKKQVSKLYIQSSNGNYTLTNVFEKDISSYYKITTSNFGNNIYEYKNSSYIALSNITDFSFYYKNEDGQYKTYDDEAILPLYYIKENEGQGTIYTAEDYDWRELIYQMAIDFYKYNQDADYLLDLESSNPQFIDGKTGYEQYYSDMQAFWRQLYNPNPTEWELDQYGEYYDAEGTDGHGSDAYWNKRIHLDPNQLKFWIDFVDVQGDLSKYSIDKIGTRSKVVNETSVKSIYFREIPEVLFIISPKETLNDMDMSYMPIWIQDGMANLFYRSAQGASAISKANELIYQHTSMNEGITLTSIPIYYLQPNTRIYVKNQGDYVLDKITYSLAHGGTMSLTGNKIIKQFY